MAHVNIDYLLNVLKTSQKSYDFEKIYQAYEYSCQLHEGQMRQSGEPYISHPIAVAEIVAELELDTDSICAALLHDTVEDCPDKTNAEELKTRFGGVVASLVDGLTKIKAMNVEHRDETVIENIRKMLLAMSKDIRVIFIKLCDRLHNMRTLAAKSEKKQREIALETMHIYAPIAHRLGMQLIKQELEMLSLMHLDPYGYEEVNQKINQKYGLNRSLLESSRNVIEAKLKENGIHYEIEGRVKSVYSLYRKIYSQHKDFDEIYDFYALRVIVDSELACYTVLGIVHEMFRSVPGRFKDYISTPKANMYRSLHTTVIGRDGIPFEVQIRTFEMHQIAEYGVAAHWKYKSGAKNSNPAIDEKLRWVSQLLEGDVDSHDPDDYIQTFKTDIFHDEIFVFTPKGDVISLPHGATVIDFAYAIHSEVGNKMIGAKINGMIVSYEKVPQNGDIVEILTVSTPRGPSRDWLNIVTTAEAKNKIRQWFKRERRPENIQLGKDAVDRELHRFGRSYTENDRNEIVASIATRMGINGGVDDFYNTLGYGGLAINKVANRLREEFEKRIPEVKPAVEPTQEEQVKLGTIRQSSRNGGIVVDGAEGCLVKFAKCCTPLPGDEIVGFVTVGHGVSIHKKTCVNYMRDAENHEHLERWLSAQWGENGNSSSAELFETAISVVTESKIGVLATISVALADMKVSILQINSQRLANDTVMVKMTIGCKNVSHVAAIESKLRGLNGILSVTRGSLAGAAAEKTVRVKNKRG